MRSFYLILLVLFANTLIHAQSPMEEGEECFLKGDYSCAINKFNEAIIKLKGEDRQLAEIQLTRAKACQEWIKAANTAFNKNNLANAIENYQYVISENPDDAYANSQLEKAKQLQDYPAQKFRKATLNDLIDIWDGKYGNGQIRREKLIASGIDPDDAQARINKNEGKSEWESRNNPTAQNGGERKYLNLSITNLQFDNYGGESRRIYVYPEGSSYTVRYLPKWATVNSFKGYFTVSCKANSERNERSDWFQVVSGDKAIRVDISQSGNPNGPGPSTTKGSTNESFSVSTTILRFKSKPEKSDRIYVYSSSGSYEVRLLPSWCLVNKYDNYFIVSCKENTSVSSRSDWFEVRSSGGVSKRIDVYQEGALYKNNFNHNAGRKNCFNCPKTRDTWGMSLGYLVKNYNNRPISGIQIGLKAEPLFKYGFGLNTGINFMAYSTQWETVTRLNKYIREYGVSIPLHLEYRLNFSKWFNIYAFAGAGYNLLIDYTSKNKEQPITLEYGVGMRINKVQITAGKTERFGNIENGTVIRKDLVEFQRLICNLSFMF